MANLKGDILHKIEKFEDGEMDRQEMVQFFVELHNNGLLLHLQGSYQRTFHDLHNNKEIAVMGNGIARPGVTALHGKAVALDEDGDMITNNTD